MLGLPKEKVFLRSVDESVGKELLLEEKIENEIGKQIKAAHYIGSTAVENLRAKLILDIVLEV
ncbi:GrpB family protein [Alkalicoccus halolimnae]|uniref:GrpB family protein n=1 Tax=Alkalicoccus halolimnae TaxID=1667239 RepID=UPI0011CCBDC4|nr:GrpB family protein [Alkalicoccus halolimnae]TXF85315.1 GrpB family protein [Alkalicoccus halolimnae]